MATTTWSSPAAFHDAAPPSPQRSQRLVVLATQIFLGIWLLFYVVNALRAVFWFEGLPVNGPFQLFDPLRRIAAGQKAGQDFVFFHGVGIPYLHYPLFWLLGGKTLQASETSRQLMSVFLFAATLAVYVCAIFRSSAARWLSATVAVLLMEGLFPLSPAPGHSLVSGRSAMPIFAFAILQWALRSDVKALLTGLTIGCAFVFGIEHGISLTVALFACGALSLVQGSLQHPFARAQMISNIRFLAITVLSAAACFAALLSWFCGFANGIKAVAYNLLGLPQDQFWLFGAPPMPYLKDLRQLIFDHHVILCFLPTVVLLLVLSSVIAVWGRRMTFQLGRDWQATAVVMLVYGSMTVTPLIGILSRHYAFPQVRILIFVALLVVANVPRFQQLLARIPAVAGPLLAAACLLLAAALLFRSAKTTVAFTQHWRNDRTTYDHTLGRKWDSFMSQTTAAIDSHRKRPEVALWSEYTALLDAHYKTFQPAEDYIIHTVGWERWVHYQQAFRNADPEFVTTMVPQFSFAEWLQDERWEFYEDLVDNYTPLGRIEHAILWQRNTGGWQTPGTSFIAVPMAADQSVTLPLAQGGQQVVVVRLAYHVVNRWAKLPLIGSTPRYLVTVDGTPRNMAVSLPPYRHSFEFPVKLSRDHHVVLRFRTDSFLPGAHLEPEGLQAKTLPWGAATQTLFPDVLGPKEF